MKQWTAVIGALAVLGPITAKAQVTAEEVWRNWQGFAETTGQIYSPGTIQRGLGTLTLLDVGVSATSPGAALRGTIDEITFRELGDGTVAIITSPQYGMTVETAQPGGGLIMRRMTVIQEGLDLVASGTPQAIRYGFSAERMTLRAHGPASSGEGSEMQFAITAEDVAGVYGVNSESTALTTDLEARTRSLTLDAAERGTDIAIELYAADVTATGETAPGVLANPAAIATRGQGTNTTLGYTDLRVSVETGQPGATRTFGAGADTGSLSVGLGGDGIRYEFEGTGLTFALSGAGVPLPRISASLDGASAELRGPILVGDTPEDFALRIDLDQLNLADIVWNSLDPTSLLPRDPARLVLDISGRMNWLADIREVDRQSGQPPAALHALQVSELRLSGGGAELSGNGAFTFDNSDLETFRGLPAPNGTFELQAAGANALIDSLVTLGLIPAEQAFFARIVAAPFLEAGTGPDTLRTRIDVSPDGGIRANGRPVR